MSLSAYLWTAIIRLTAGLMAFVYLPLVKAADFPTRSPVVHLTAASSGKPQASKWVEGTHYYALNPQQPPEITPGKIEVVEVFWYACPHCADLEPYLEKWSKRQQADIQFVRIPVLWRVDQVFHAKLFYTLEALGRSDLHWSVFETLNVEQKLLSGNDNEQTLKLQVEFAKAHGLDEEAYRKAYNSPEVTTYLQHANQRIRRFKTEGVPLIVINGKYSTDIVSAGGQKQLITLIDALVARERSR